MTPSEKAQWMRRCLHLASLGAASAAPNPMVGAVLVQGKKVLAEGWHHAAGAPHAEVECLNAFGAGPVPKDAVLFVNLEPCAHHGRTPPCAEMLVQRGVGHVVVGLQDPFPAVAGKGIDILEAAGIMVEKGVLAEECRWAQRRFLASVEQGRPYIVLKWARSKDGFLDQHPRTERTVQRISGPSADVLVHKWRSEEQAILVGSRTVVNDNPSLTVRHVVGNQPLRVVMDRSCITPGSSKVFNTIAKSLLLTSEERPDVRVDQLVVPAGSDPMDAMLNALHDRQIRSVLVEGGAELLGHFISRDLWDEARIITGRVLFEQGTPAPIIPGSPTRSMDLDNDRVDLFLNANSASLKLIKPTSEWPW